MIFKINGERNSGTSFLYEIIKKNFGESRVVKSLNYPMCKTKFWPHGSPDPRVKQIDDCVVDIFIFRRLEPWLVSMFKNPYELRRFHQFNEFLIGKQRPVSPFTDYYTGKLVNYDDLDRTIFQIRYKKYKDIVDYCKNNDNCIVISLDFLQDETKCDSFIDLLKEMYNIDTENEENITSIETQLATGKKITTQSEKNRIYFDVSEFNNDIDLWKDGEIENHINNLDLELHNIKGENNEF